MDYRDTLHLPRTNFSMRGELATKEPALLQRWRDQALYEQILQARASGPRFVLHDGPPYANGHLHHGHILNKILKDIVVKDRTMQGMHCAFVPGWDCHGLPIEVQVDKKLGAAKATMSKGEVRRACRAYAEEYVGIQRREFERLGVLGRWDAPYQTMHPAYEARTLRELARFVEQGLVYKGLRPVNWCAVHQTALAEAEVEYDDHTSPSIYVALRLLDPDADIVIWTTTPWTLPANRAVSVHPDFEYASYPVRGRMRIVARALLPEFLQAIGERFDEANIGRSWRGTELQGVLYRHPLLARDCPILAGEHVALEATGCVHTAPGHGGDDFEMGRRHDLEIASPVDARGVFTDGPFTGEHVFKANPKIIAHLAAAGSLLSPPDATVRHRYAHCWRCHQPIILRATEQWWVAVDQPYAGGASLRDRALAALQEVQWIPGWGQDRIRGMLEARPDWCLSRQRVWGVPIAVVYCDTCGAAKLDAALMHKVADRFEVEGADAWFTRSVLELCGDLRCEGCGGTTFRKEEDILDVWFDSGVSYAAVIEDGGLGQVDGPPVDLVLEGSDQHRGWFHSSLLCALATREQPPYRAVLTHGFVVDGQGKKISKSKGNFVDPFKGIDEQGAELLRLWVAAEDYRNDIRISDEILRRLSDLYRKVRNTIRFMLGNVSDFDPNLPMPPLRSLDRYALALNQTVGERVRAAYQSASFHVVVQTLNEWCTVHLSAFYLDILKDRLYCSAAASDLRRGAQAALYLITRDLLRLMAPILSFTAEEAWASLPRLAGDPTSVHLAMYPGIAEPHAIMHLRKEVADPASVQQFETLRGLRERVNAALERARRDKVIGSSTEAAVVVDATAAERDAAAVTSVADFLIVSQVSLGASLLVEKAPGTKCPRCWLFHGGRDLCSRCQEVLQ
jgi:isoleucyl-tRNA synthetase